MTHPTPNYGNAAAELALRCCDSLATLVPAVDIPGLPQKSSRHAATCHEAGDTEVTLATRTRTTHPTCCTRSAPRQTPCSQAYAVYVATVCVCTCV